jgi:hypothetical protein
MKLLYRWKEIMRKAIKCMLVLMLVAGTTQAYCDENASNPLAAVNNIDVRWQHFDLDGPEVNNFYLEGGVMLNPKLKLKYELHYWETDLSGSSENDWESARIKPIYFPKQGKIGDWGYKLAIGGELIVDFDNDDKGIGSGSDQISPFAGVAFVRGGTVLVPLVQHYVEYSGPDVNTTAFRLIGIQSLPNKFWGKLDAKIPIDWEDDNAIPATVEVQLGKMFSPAFGIYMDGLVGVGGDKPYDWGVGVGLRFNFVK